MLIIHLVLHLASAANCHLTPIPDVEPTVQLLLQATTEIVIRGDFMTEAHTIYVSWVSADEHLASQLANLCDQLLQVLQGNLLVQHVGNHASINTMRPRVYNIFLVDSPEAFDEIYMTICPKLYDFAGQFLIVVLTDDITDVLSLAKHILQLMWKYYVVNVDVLFASSATQEASLYTYFPFTATVCEEVNPIAWNSFHDGKFNQHRRHYPSKLGNFHQCPLSAAVYTYGAFMQLFHGPGGVITEMNGIDGQVLHHMSRKLNFTIIPREVPSGLRFGLIFPNGTTTGAMQMVTGGETNFTLGFFGNNLLRNQYMFLTQNYHYSQLVMVVSAGQEYEAFEKLLLPFSKKLWIAFVSHLAIAFSIIFMISRTNTSIRNFVFGNRVHTPSLNLLNILLGGSLPILPGRNFARFLLMLWIIHGLILRTVYQQALFNLLQQSPNRSTATTLAQLIDEDYPIYVLPTQVYVFDKIPELKRQLRVIPSAQFAQYGNAIRRGQLRGALVSNFEKVLFDNSKFEDAQYFRLLKQRLYNYPVCVGLRLNSCLKKPFDDVLLELNPYGLVQAWVNQYVNRKYATVPEPVDERKQLTVRQLLGAFQVWLIALSASFVVFCCEIIWVFLRKK